MTENEIPDEGDVDGLGVLPVDGSELTYRVTGAGPPVVLIHGGFGVLEVWGDVQDTLATTHRVISYDRRGHGRSPNGSPDMRVHGRDAAALIEHVAGEPAIVVGWSNGASVAMELVRSHPEQVETAVLIEPPFHAPVLPSLRGLGGIMWNAIRGRPRAAAEAGARFVFARRSGGNGWDELDDDQREWFLGDAEGMLGENKLSRYQAGMPYVSTKEVAEWSVPMIYLLGEDSAQWLHDVHGTLTEAAPQIRTVRVPGACHLLPVQQPEAVVDAVRSAGPE